MPEVRNTGTTVTTDGVTIQGNGASSSPVAIKAVQTDATLTGAGTVASPLSAAQQMPSGWPITWLAYGGPYSNAIFSKLATVANTLVLYGISFPAAVRFGHIVINLITGDNANNSDVGFYSAAGALLAHVGAQHFNFTGNSSIAVVGGAVAIGPGRAYFATTSVGTVATIANSNDAGSPSMFLNQANFGSSTGGSLPASITPPADTIAVNGPIFALTT